MRRKKENKRKKEDMGMPARAHSAVPAPSPALLMFSASWFTVSTLFEIAPIKCFFPFFVGDCRTVNFVKLS